MLLSPKRSISSRPMTIFDAVEARLMTSSVGVPLTSTRSSCSAFLAPALAGALAAAAGAEAAGAGLGFHSGNRQHGQSQAEDEWV